MMTFEYDARKSRSNMEKHGIDFEGAKLLWDDPDLLEIPARTEDEPRFMVIGRIAGSHWSGIITYREDVVRIISVRRSRPEEVALYEG
ncbi:MAG: BrnT family toxin [Dehalococcoidia bacterium]|nr:BrnT family toxin [Dehalococcoidia bacterium]